MMRVNQVKQILHHIEDSFHR